MNDLFDGAALRDKGIKESSEHAEATHEGWNKKADDLLLSFLLTYTGDTFLCEDARTYAEAFGLPNPPDKRAWGGVIVRARRKKLITAVGYSFSKKANCHKSPNTLWKKS